MTTMNLQTSSAQVTLEIGRAILEGRPLLEMQFLESEGSLIERAVKRDGVAFTALYESHVDRVYRHVYYWLPSQADAEDITQEVFVRAWKSIHKYKRTGAPLIAWLTKIARNLVNDYYRAKKRLVPLPETDPPANNNDGPEAIIELSFNRNYVRDAILKLKGEKQEVIQMRFIDELSYGEIARALNKSEGAVRVIQYRALKELKHLLGGIK